MVVNKAVCGSRAVARKKKINLEEEAIREILVSDNT